MSEPEKTIITIFNAEGIDNILETDLKKFLGDHEKMRYQKLGGTGGKDFVAGRVALGEALIRFSKVQHTTFSPFESRVKYEQSDKPFLEGNQSIAISISHSNGWGVASVSKLKFVAIDIEKIKARDISLIEYIFSKRERDIIKRKITDEILTVSWTMKEAIMKGLGVGLISPRLIALREFFLYDDGYMANFTYQQSQAETQFWMARTILVDRYAISVAYPKKLHESIIFDWNLKIGLQPTKQISIS